MRKIALLSLFACVLMPAASGQLWKQSRVEVSIGVGPTQFFGDIGGYSPEESVLGFRDISLRQTRFNISTAASYRLLRDVNLRLNLVYGMFHANDKWGSNTDRGFASTTSFFEQTVVGEFYFIKNRSESSFLFSRGRGDNLRTFMQSLDFYVLGGIGGLAYSVNGNEALTSNGLKEGGFTVVMPAGAGLKFIYSPEFSFGIELGGRYSFSDSLEGYTSQYSRSNDVYYFLNATVTYKMRTNLKGVPTFRR